MLLVSFLMGMPVKVVPANMTSGKVIDFMILPNSDFVQVRGGRIRRNLRFSKIFCTVLDSPAESFKEEILISRITLLPQRIHRIKIFFTNSFSPLRITARYIAEEK